MASAVTTTSSSSHLPSSYTLTAKRSNRTLRRPLASSASTPNLHAAYSASRPRSAVSPNRAAGAASGAPAAAGAPAASSSGRGRSLSRKPSLAVLSETAPPLPSANVPPLPTGGLDFAILADHTASPASPEHHNTAAMAPLTPGRASSVAPPDTVTVGDSVDVPGNMFGVVRFVGPVQGKKGVFAGVELDADFAPRGKNNGDVDGVSYFTTSIPGAGIFLPLSKALRRDPSTPFPATPSTAGLRTGSQNSTNYTPPTPGLPKFSASVGPGARAPSPAGKRPGTSGGRLSLPRPESPIRRTQMTPGPRPSFGAPSAAKTPGRHASPTSNRFAQSVRGTAGDPNKRTLDRKPSMPVRSASALGFDDDPPVPALPRTQTNGSTASFRNQTRSPSRNAPRGGASDEQLELLRSQLEDRERQLRDQSATLAEMESSLTELQTLMMHADGPGGAAANNAETEGKDVTQLRALLREKNDKIAMLTSEFDSHRADFRSTIDALEMASTETERVYEKRMEELMADVRELESRNLDVDSVASQLKQLEELVQELEEGLEDARRGEAEARGEVEFLRGEVERTRTELLREREKSGSPATGSGHRKSTSASMSAAMASKELEAREDEIRGLKAIIHSLSRDSAGGGAGSRGSAPPAQRRGSILPGDVIEHKIARDNLERQVAELQGILKEKTSREEELEQELEKMRAAGGGAGGATPQQPQRPLSTQRSSYRDSRDTVVLTRSPIEEPPTPVVPAAAIVNGSGNVDKPNHADDDNVNGGNSGLGLHNLASNQHRRGPMLDATAESDAHSNATENSTLWCEICEAPGHDILTCTNMFGPDGGASSSKTGGGAPGTTDGGLGVDDGAHPAPLSPLKTTKSPILGSAAASSAPPPAPAPTRVLPNPMDSGPVAGKESGIMDPEKWCAVCERDGHDSVDCPFEDAF